MPELIGSFRSKHPDVRVTLLIGSSREVQAWVEEARVEIGVMGAPPTARALEAQPLMADEIVLVVGAEHPWATRQTVTLDDLKVEPLIVRERGSGSRATFEEALAGLGLDLGSFRVVGEIGSTQAVKQAVRAGVGVSMISRRAVEDECRARLLACVKIQDLTVTRAFHLVTHRERSRSPLAQAFLTFVESQVAARAS
jgi:DNA-binding transcriptional LysR family regulator